MSWQTTASLRPALRSAESTWFRLRSSFGECPRRSEADAARARGVVAGVRAELARLTRRRISRYGLARRAAGCRAAAQRGKEFSVPGVVALGKELRERPGCLPASHPHQVRLGLAVRNPVRNAVLGLRVGLSICSMSQIGTDPSCSPFLYSPRARDPEACAEQSPVRG